MELMKKEVVLKNNISCPNNNNPANLRFINVQSIKPRNLFQNERVGKVVQLKTSEIRHVDSVPSRSSPSNEVRSNVDSVSNTSKGVVSKTAECHSLNIDPTIAKPPNAPNVDILGNCFFLPSNGSAVVDMSYNRFINDLIIFHKQKGTDICRLPTINSRVVNLKYMYTTIVQFGGLQNIYDKDLWKNLIKRLGLENCCFNIEESVRIIYIRFLEGYERKNFHKETADVESENYEKSSTGRRLDIHSIASPYPLKKQKYTSQRQMTEALQHKQLRNKVHDYFELDRLLVCNLANQTDFAFNLCLLLSFDSRSFINIRKGPQIVKYILSHVGIFESDESEFITHVFKDNELYYQYWWENVTDRQVLEFSLGQNFDLKNNTTDVISNGSFAPKDDDKAFLLRRRILNVATILYNFSLTSVNNDILLDNPCFLKFVFLACKIKTCNIRKLAVNILAHVARFIKVDVHDGSIHIMMKITNQLLFSPDRQLVISGCEIIAGLGWNILNINWIYETVKGGIFDRTVSLLHVGDVQIVIYALEVFYKLSKNGDSLMGIVHDHYTFVQMLVSFLTLKGARYGPKSLMGNQLIENTQMKKVNTRDLASNKNVFKGKSHIVSVNGLNSRNGNVQNRNVVHYKLQKPRRGTNIQEKTEIVHHKPNQNHKQIVRTSRPTLAPIRIPVQVGEKDKNLSYKFSAANSQLPDNMQFSTNWIKSFYRPTFLYTSERGEKNPGETGICTISTDSIISKYNSHCKDLDMTPLSDTILTDLICQIFPRCVIKRDEKTCLLNLVQLESRDANRNNKISCTNDNLKKVAQDAVKSVKNLNQLMNNSNTPKIGNCVNLKRKLSSPLVSNSNYKTPSKVNKFSSITSCLSAPLYGTNKQTIEKSKIENQLLPQEIVKQDENVEKPNDTLISKNEIPVHDSFKNAHVTPPIIPETSMTAKVSIDINAKYVCKWSECCAAFQEQEEYVHHIMRHWSDIKEFPTPCAWKGCVDDFPRCNFSLYGHVKETHGVEDINSIMKTVATKIHPKDAAALAISRFSSIDRYFVFPEEKEGNVTKHWRLTAALIMENCCRDSKTFRRILKTHEIQLIPLIYAKSETSKVLMKILTYLSNNLDTECEKTQ